MNKKLSLVAGIVCILMMVTFLYTLCQDGEPVQIQFRENASRKDLVTGETLPDYTSILRGSVRFHLTSITESDDFIQYYHDGLRQVPIQQLGLIENAPDSLTAFFGWRLGNRGVRSVHHQIVSFVPLAH